MRRAEGDGTMAAGSAAGSTVGSTAGGTAVLRRLNTAVVLDAVRRAAPSSVRITELTSLTGLTRPTVSQVVDQLLQQDWLVQHPPPATASGMGRPAARFSLNGRAAPVLGLDVGPHTVTAAVADLGGSRLCLVRKRVRRLRPTELLATIDAAIDAALAEAAVAADRIAAVVVGTPGLVDREAGVVTLAPSVPGWQSVNLVQRLQRRLSCPVRLENDANLAALAISASRDGWSGTLLAVQWGERLGAGIVIDGQLHRGAGAAAGEIGFIAAGGDSVIPDADGRGSLERHVGAEAIGRHGIAAAQSFPRSMLATMLAVPAADPAAAVFAAAAGGDRQAIAIVHDVALAFAAAIAPVVLALDPHAIVIGGGVARAGTVLTDAISVQLAELTLTRPAIELSALAEDAVVTGALQLAVKDVWAARFPQLPMRTRQLS